MMLQETRQPKQSFDLRVVVQLEFIPYEEHRPQHRIEVTWPSASDGTIHSVLSNIADLPWLRLHFKAVEVRAASRRTTGCGSCFRLHCHT
jgi:hypothetical protein